MLPFRCFPLDFPQLFLDASRSNLPRNLESLKTMQANVKEKKVHGWPRVAAVKRKVSGFLKKRLIRIQAVCDSLWQPHLKTESLAVSPLCTRSLMNGFKSKIFAV
jgi:hypothetical protein